MAGIEPTVWESDNEYGIPDLDIDQQADEVAHPFTIWGSVARGTPMPGTWGFYTEDYRFTSLWSDPRPVIRSGCKSIIEPNFSCYQDMPLAVGIWAIYKKRWLSRWFQSQGVGIIADLCVAPKFLALNMLGIPQGWSVYATRGYVKYISDLEQAYKAACDRSLPNVPVFYVYGGSKKIRDLCWFYRNIGWHHIIERADLIKEQRKAVA